MDKRAGSVQDSDSDNQNRDGKEGRHNCNDGQNAEKIGNIDDVTAENNYENDNHEGSAGANDGVSLLSLDPAEIGRVRTADELRADRISQWVGRTQRNYPCNHDPANDFDTAYNIDTNHSDDTTGKRKGRDANRIEQVEYMEIGGVRIKVRNGDYHSIGSQKLPSSHPLNTSCGKSKDGGRLENKNRTNISIATDKVSHRKDDDYVNHDNESGGYHPPLNISESMLGIKTDATEHDTDAATLPRFYDDENVREEQKKSSAACKKLRR